ncbi:hypothetical protein GX586_06660, partial [bacterium]|nr:hypothetical protein [bacterium]
MKRIACVVFVMAVVAAHQSGMAAVLYSQGFNSDTIPADWATEIVSNAGSTLPAVTFVTASAHPTDFTPYEGTHFVRFNSYSCTSWNSIRLKRTTSISTLGMNNVGIQFAWTRDTGYSSNADRVIVQFSTNGTAWIDAGTYQRNGGAANYWEVNNCILPPAACNQPAVYIAFRFISAYGNDCHLDDVSVLQVNSLPPTAFTASAAGTSRIDLSWMTNAAGQPVIIASNTVDTFGAPVDGTAYYAGSALPGGGGIIYKGTATAFPHTGLMPDTKYYYRAWSVNAATQ